MATSCANITDNVLLNCQKIISAGANDNLFLLNFDDLATITRDNTNPNLIESFTLNSGAFLYKFQGFNDSVEPRSALVKTRYSANYDHEVTLKLFDNTADLKEQIDALKLGRVIAVVENNFAGSDDETKFEIYGLNAGLVLEEMERIVADTETQGAYNLVLRSSERSKEPNLPATLFDTSIAVTRAFINSLVKP
jgi:hypothetical protein